MINKRSLFFALSFFLSVNLIGCFGSSGGNDGGGGGTGPSINNPPTVSLTGNPTSGNAPLTVNFTANASDSDGNIVKYEWDCDGNNAFDTATTAGTLIYTYSNSETCNAKVRVTDNGGATAEATVAISVSAAAMTLTFTPSGTPGNNSVYLSQASTNNDTITLSINAKGVTNVHGAAIEITFDGSKISYISASQGNLLNNDGANTIFTPGLEQGSNGILLIAIDRTGTNMGVNGDGILATIVLKALTTQANTPVNFNITNSALKLPSGGGSIGGVSWLGGSLSYQ